MNNPFFQAQNRIRRTPYKALAAILILTMTLFLAAAFFLIAAGSQAVLRYFETRPQVNAFYKQDVIPTSQEVELIKSKLMATEKIESFKYVSKEDALVIYKNLNKNDPLLLEAVTAGMLPASLEVSAKDPNDLKIIADMLIGEKGIEDVRFAEDVVSSLSVWTRSVRMIGIVLVGAHVVISFATILLIIGIKVSDRRDEINLLQLLGATDGYIIAPFVWEGISYGLVSGFIAWGLAYLVLLYSTPFLVSFLAGLPVLPVPIWFMVVMLGGVEFLGVVIGALGAMLATARYLRS